MLHLSESSKYLMRLRIDHLLASLRDRPHEILAAIDGDPLLLKREVNGLVLANATKALFTPLVEHQLFAKGIIYRRDPYRLVSLPLIKIYNLGERNVTVHDLVSLQVPGSRAHFLRKFDGTMIQRFQHDGRVYFSTRGMLEGVVLPTNEAQDEDAPPQARMFDYLAAARETARAMYPQLVEPWAELEGVTLILELLHPEARVITDYKGRRDLVLLAAFDTVRHVYWPYERIRRFANEHRLVATDAFRPDGPTLAKQVDSLLASLAGTDEEGTVVVVEHGDEVVYRVKVKSQDYLRMLKLMVRCTYPATVEMLDGWPSFPDWPAMEEKLQALGSEKVPEELLAQYREHYDAFAAYRSDCETLRARIQVRSDELRKNLSGHDPRAVRKEYAQRALREPFPPLFFSAFDGKLDIDRVREIFATHPEVREALRVTNT